MSKDVNDEVRSGASVDDLFSAGTPMERPAIPLAQAIEIVEGWKDGLAGADDVPAAIVESFADNALVRALATMMLEARGQLEAVLAKLRAHRGASKSISTLERLAKAEAREQRRKASAKPVNVKVQSEASLRRVLEGLPVSGVAMPPGYTIANEGVFAPDGAQISLGPIVLLGRAVDEQTGRMALMLAWRLGGRWIRWTADRATIVNHRNLLTLSSYGAPFSPIAAAPLAQFLAEQEASSSFEEVRSTSKQGWVGNKTFLWGYTALGQPDITLVPEEAERAMAGRFASSGSFEGWAAAMQKHAINKPHVMLALYASIAAVLIKILGVEAFILDLSAETSAGKSKALEAAASVWGRPSSDGGVMRRWNTTVVGIENLAGFLNNLPVILDETKLRRSDSVVATAAYMLPSGEGSKRGNSDASSKPIKTWATVTISSGEAPLTTFTTDHGSKARVLTLTGRPFGEFGEEGRLAAEDFSRLLLSDYGHLGPRVIEALLALADHWPEMRERWASTREAIAENIDPTVSAAIHRSVTGPRLLAHVATLQLAGELAHEAGLPGVDKLKENIAFAIEQIARGAAGSDMPTAALEELYSWCWANQHAFYGRAVDDHGRALRIPPAGGWVGVWESGDRWEEIGIRVSIVDERLAAWKFDVQAIRASFKQREWLRLDANNQNPVCGPAHTRMLCIKREAIEKSCMDRGAHARLRPEIEVGRAS